MPKAAPAAAPKPAADPGGKADFEADILVLGAGPGGYTAAFRAADLGRSVVLVDARQTLGGVCLNVGCIPSKALLHVAKIIDEAAAMGAHGVKFGQPSFDPTAIRGWKDGVIRLTGGLTGLAKQRKVRIVTGRGKFTSPNTLQVETAEGARSVRFKNAIIAAGSEPVAPGFIPADPRIWDSTAALEMSFIPKRMLVLGGGIIGLEMATVYYSLGAGVTVIEMMDQLMPGADPDIVAPLAKQIGKLYDKILLKTKVTKVEAKGDELHVSYEGPAGATTEVFDAILVSVGRRPNGKAIGAEAAGVAVDERGFILSIGRCAPTFSTSSPSATSSASRCSRIKARMKARSPRRSRAGTIPRLTPRRYRRSLTPILKSPGRVRRRRKPRPRGSNSARRSSRGRQAAGRSRSAATRA